MKLFAGSPGIGALVERLREFTPLQVQSRIRLPWPSTAGSPVAAAGSKLLPSLTTALLNTAVIGSLFCKLQKYLHVLKGDVIALLNKKQDVGPDLRMRGVWSEQI